MPKEFKDLDNLAYGKCICGSSLKHSSELSDQNTGSFFVRNFICDKENCFKYIIYPSGYKSLFRIVDSNNEIKYDVSTSSVINSEDIITNIFITIGSYKTITIGFHKEKALFKTYKKAMDDGGWTRFNYHREDGPAHTNYKNGSVEEYFMYEGKGFSSKEEYELFMGLSVFH